MEADLFNEAFDPDGAGPEHLSAEGARAARARYMRFWRSITSSTKSTPPVVLEAVNKLRGGSGARQRSALTDIFEDWMQAKEQWLGP